MHRSVRENKVFQSAGNVPRYIWQAHCRAPETIERIQGAHQDLQRALSSQQVWKDVDCFRRKTM